VFYPVQQFPAAPAIIAKMNNHPTSQAMIVRAAAPRFLHAEPVQVFLMIYNKFK
jgi:hypothetical protein